MEPFKLSPSLLLSNNVSDNIVFDRHNYNTFVSEVKHKSKKSESDMIRDKCVKHYQITP